MPTNPCQEMENKLMNKFSEFEDKATPVQDKIDELNNVLDGKDFGTDDIKKADTDISRNASNIKDSIRSYAGSCLDSVIGSAEEAEDLAEDWVDQIPTGPVGVLIERISSTKMLFNKLNLSSYVGSINELLGCLSSSDCNFTNNVQSVLQKMERYSGFTSKGFSVEDVINKNKLPVSTDKAKQLENLSEKTVDKVEGAKTKVPSNLF